MERFITTLFTKLFPRDFKTNAAWYLLRFLYSSNPSAFQVIKAADDPNGIHAGKDGKMYISIAVNAPSAKTLTLHIYVSKNFGLYKALQVTSKIKDETGYYMTHTVANFVGPTETKTS